MQAARPLTISDWVPPTVAARPLKSLILHLRNDLRPSCPTELLS